MYGKKDPYLTDDARDTLEKFEDRYWAAATEHNQEVRADGSVVAEQHKGRKGSVSIPVYVLMQSDAGTHNHPRREGVLGGTFSGNDIDIFCDFEQTARATAKEGTYSISKLPNFDEQGFRKYYSETYKRLHSDYEQAVAAVTRDYYDTLWKAKGSSAEKAADAAYERGRDREFNRFLVNLHNAYLDGQSRYGYYYTLERRGK